MIYCNTNTYFNTYFDTYFTILGIFMKNRFIAAIAIAALASGAVAFLYLTVVEPNLNRSDHLQVGLLVAWIEHMPVAQVSHRQSLRQVLKAASLLR